MQSDLATAADAVEPMILRFFSMINGTLWRCVKQASTKRWLVWDTKVSWKLEENICKKKDDSGGQAMNFGTLQGSESTTRASAICSRLFKHSATVVHLAGFLTFLIDSYQVIFCYFCNIDQLSTLGNIRITTATHSFADWPTFSFWGWVALLFSIAFFV